MERSYLTTTCTGSYTTSFTPTPSCLEESQSGSFGRLCVHPPTHAPTPLPTAAPTVVPTVAPTVQGLGNVGFVVGRSYPTSTDCSGDYFAADVLGTGVCFSNGDGSRAVVLVSTDGGKVDANLNSYTDTACTVLESTEAISARSTCTGNGAGGSLVYEFSTSPPNPSSFGNGVFGG